MKKTTIVAICLAIAFTGIALADNPPEGGAGDQNGGGTCKVCIIDHFLEVGNCYPSPNGNLADCSGGQICYWDGQKWNCEAYCGRQQCYYV